MVASRNQGKSLKGTNSSRSSTNSQNPCGETLVTSAGEVLGPGGADLIKMLLDQGLDFRNLLWLQTEVAGQLHGRIDPELRFAIGMLNVNVSSSFLTGKEVKPISLDPQDRRTHRTSIAEATPAEDIATT